jgi:tripartite ATP-independent transporter DctP family solute receptor
MGKHPILTILTIIILLLVFTVSGSIAQTRTFKVSYNVAAGSSWDKGAQKFKEIVEKRSGGKYKIETYPNAVLAQGTDRVEIEMTQSGVIQFLIKSSMWLPALDKRFQIIQMPFQFPNHAVAEAVMDGPAGNMLISIFPKHRLVGLAWGANGFRQVTNSKREIRTPEDLKGLKMRVPGIELAIAIFKSFGSVPITMSFADVFTALQQGTVDGQENPLSLIWSSRFFEVQKYCTLWNYMYDAVCFISNKALWDSLSKEDKQMFSQAAKEAMDFERQVVQGEDKSLVPELESKGMKLTRLTASELKPFKEVTKKVYDEFKEKLGKGEVELFEREVAKAMKKSK